MGVFASAYVYALCPRLLSAEAGKGYVMPCSWRYRQLWATVCGLGMEPESSACAVSGSQLLSRLSWNQDETFWSNKTNTRYFSFLFSHLPIEQICLFVYLLLVFWDRVSLGSPGCPETCSVDQAGLELTENSVYWVLGWKTCAFSENKHSCSICLMRGYFQLLLRAVQQ